MADDYYFTVAPADGRNGTQIPAVSANDPRIPPPAPWMGILTEPGAPPMLVSASGDPIATVSQATGDEDMPKKIGIYATRGDEFTISVLDEANDPVDGGSFRYSASDIVGKIKPMLEAAGHKVVDYSAGSLNEVASEGKVTPLRRTRAK